VGPAQWRPHGPGGGRQCRTGGKAEANTGVALTANDHDLGTRSSADLAMTEHALVPEARHEGRGGPTLDHRHPGGAYRSQAGDLYGRVLIIRCGPARPGPGRDGFVATLQEDRPDPRCVRRHLRRWFARLGHGRGRLAAGPLRPGRCHGLPRRRRGDHVRSTPGLTGRSTTPSSGRNATRRGERDLLMRTGPWRPERRRRSVVLGRSPLTGRWGGAGRCARR